METAAGRRRSGRSGQRRRMKARMAIRAPVAPARIASRRQDVRLHVMRQCRNMCLMNPYITRTYERAIRKLLLDGIERVEGNPWVI